MYSTRPLIEIIIKFTFFILFGREKCHERKKKTEGEIERERFTKKWNIFDVWQESNNLQKCVRERGQTA